MNKEKIEINWSKFKRVFDYNPFFIHKDIEQTFFDIENKYFDLKWNSKYDQVVNDTSDDVNDGEEKEIDFDLMQSLSIEPQKDSFSLVELEEFKVSHDLDALFDQKINENTSNKYILVKATSFDRYKNDAIKFYVEKYNIKPEEVKYISIKETKELKEKITLDLYNDPKVKLIISPVFSFIDESNEIDIEYKGSFLMYDKINNKVIDLAYKHYANQDYFYKFFYLNQILKENNIKVDDFSVIIVDPFIRATKQFESNKIPFYEAFSGPRSFSQPSGDKAKEIYSQAQSVYYTSGYYFLYDEANKEASKTRGWSFYNCIKNQKIIKRNNVAISKNASYDFVNLKNVNEFLNKYPEIHGYKTFDESKDFEEIRDFGYYSRIIAKSYLEFELQPWNYEAYKYFLYTESKDKYRYYDLWLEGQTNYETENSLREKVAKNFYDKKEGDIKTLSGISIPSYLKKDKTKTSILLNYLIGPEYKLFSGNYLKTADLKSNTTFLHKKNEFDSAQNYFDVNIANIVRQLHIKDARICWYDYEGFADLYPILEGWIPYGQVTNQVSIIVTQNGVEERCLNIVKDTKNLTLMDICEMIDEIYADKADYYVVYNKTYENSRNEDVKQGVIKYMNQQNPSNEVKRFQEWFNNRYESIYEFTQKIDHIKLHTVDLDDCFDYKNINNWKKASEESSDSYYFAFETTKGDIIPTKLANDFEKVNKATYNKSLSTIKYLNFFYSIKKIEKYITHDELPLKHLITPYTELEDVQKGTDAMEKAIQRYMGSISDNVWEKQIVPNLKKYCENDVRAMIMVYDLIMFMLRKFIKNIDEIEYKVEERRFKYVYEPETNELKVVKLSNV
ncbi:DUF2779 domain-containing protein [Mycoplasma sp. NEAQ87857]|uniref:UU173 family protein n=1 Tax=Mycoplasma sp. NEAQ87857 TaxID=2683967 RepID=UPI0013172692|nr:DUF2779 domain-containing protein [Mycoplasma sp. NEAQ87857]QGZ97434.1 DUF2779 domain-containing protein [Mycoplasma sp. NEAQ87857]